MANWSNPLLTSTYTNFLNELKARDEDLAKQFDGQTVSNLVAGTIRWNSTINRWQKWSGTAWGELTTTYALTGLSTTANSTATFGGTLAVTGATTLAAATATTPTTSDNSTAIATTAFVKAQGYAPLASPALTGTPTAPTAATSTNTTQVATTAFVVGQINNDALAKSGGTLTGVLQTVAGTAAAPAIGIGQSNTGLFRPATGILGVAAGGSEAFRVDSGRLLIGSTAAIDVGSVSRLLQCYSNSGAAGLSTARFSADANGCNIAVGKSRGANVGDLTAVSSGDDLGQFSGYGTDGTGFVLAANITVQAGGAPGSGSVPGDIAFSTRAAGGNVLEAFRITSEKVFTRHQAAPVSKSAAATLTIADLKGGIIQYTGAAASLTLPTGTLTEGGFVSPYNNMTFEWSVINTGSGTCTIADNGTSHVVVGSRTIAAGTSGRFASRRTGTNTFTAYRLA